MIENHNRQRQPGVAYNLLSRLGGGHRRGLKVVAHRFGIPYNTVLTWSRIGPPKTVWPELIAWADEQGLKLTERTLAMKWKKGRARL